MSRLDNMLCRCSALLELSASDDLIGFKSEIVEKGLDVNEAGYWYGRRLGSRTMGFEERTPLMIAATFGSSNVLKFIIETGKVDVNRASSSDKATALHCAVSGGADSSVEIVRLLIDASADANCVDARGNKPRDLFPPLKSSLNARRKLESLLKGEALSEDEEEKLMMVPQLSREGAEKKEYPIDISLPDINNGIYGSDEFRMYCFKVKPCSRAYSHDWTECPFVHPGENARRRDPRKYPYSCVPCPEFRKGSCLKGDACEYAHGVFESWLHPAQYRTRLCKDETGCARKVCFFAHKPEELRPVYASTGSAMPSPRSSSVSAMDMASLMSPLALGAASSMPLPTASTPPMSPLASSPKSGSMWQNKLNFTPPVLQLPGSRLKSALSARDLDLDMELLGLENHNSSPMHHRQQLMDFNRLGELKPTNLDDVFGSLDPSLLSPLHGISTPTHLSSPTGLQMRQNMNPFSSPVRKPAPTSYGFDSSAAVAAALMNSRSSAFSKRSQSFVDRGAMPNRLGLTTAANSPSMMSSANLSDWSAPDGKLDWGIQGDELNKLRKSASFGYRTTPAAAAETAAPNNLDEPDVSWVNTLVKDVPSGDGYGNGARDSSIPPWMEQMYIEQEQMVA